jgi:hypothetical protein
MVSSFLTQPGRVYPGLFFMTAYCPVEAVESVSYLPAELPFEIPAGLTLLRLNDKEQIAFADGSELKLYLPSPDHGLASGRTVRSPALRR